jgi:hypothetical protein
MVSYLSSFPESVASASATFQLVLLRPTICVFPLRPARALRLMPCLAGELGAITGKGSDIAAPRTEQRFWGALLVPLRFELDLSKSWLVQLEASLMVPATRYRFVFIEPQTSIYEVPALGFAAGLRIGAQL